VAVFSGAGVLVQNPDLAKKYLANKLNAKEANNGVFDIREASERSLIVAIRKPAGNGVSIPD
jgi:hypothetical protein